MKSEIHSRSAFTLTELLIVMTIIALLSGLGLSAMSGATNLARQQRAASMITKIDHLIGERYEGYRTRAVPIRIPPGSMTSRGAALARLNALRELMRMELPDRRSDIINFATTTPSLQLSVTGIAPAALQKSYFRTAVRAMGGSPANLANWSSTFEGSECLYLILSTMRDGDKSALDYFQPGEIGDADEDGMKEILDGWGMPIEFIRWPAGYAEQPGPDGAWGVKGVDDDGNGVKDDVTEAGTAGSDDILVSTTQTRNYLKAPDPFDPAKVDPRWGAGMATSYVKVAPQPYALYPLIFSAGPDKLYDIDVVGNLVYVQTVNLTAVPPIPPNDPYYTGSGSTIAIVGRPFDANGDGTLSFYDNITNHSLRNQ